MVNRATTHHQGRLVAEYRRNRNWSQPDLAEALGVDVRTVQRLEGQEVIRNIARKQFLVGLLGIPAVLMGLEEDSHHAEPVDVRINEDRMSFFEDEMATRWEMYYTGGTSRTARGLRTWTQEIRKSAEAARGTPWQGRAVSLLAMSFQLESCTYRDTLMYDEAHQAYQRALKLGRALGNQELMASAMAREGVTLIQQERTTEAITILRSALEMIHRARLPSLRGYILQALSEAYAKAQEPQHCWQCIGSAERILERTEESEEFNQARFNSASLMAQKGVDAVLLREEYRAISLIDRSLISYDPTRIRGRARLLAQKAEAYQNLGLLDACISTAEEALTLGRSVGSSKTISRIERLHESLAASPSRREPRVARLGALLRT